MTPKHTFSAGAIVLNAHDEVAVVSQKGSSWSLPKGHVEDGEDEVTAAIREVREETGLTDLVFVRKLGEYSRHRLDAHGRDDSSEIKTITVFLFRTTQAGLRPQDPDNPQALWVAKEEVPAMLTHPVDQQKFIEYCKLF